MARFHIPILIPADEYGMKFLSLNQFISLTISTTGGKPLSELVRLVVYCSSTISLAAKDDAVGDEGTSPTILMLSLIAQLARDRRSRQGPQGRVG
jgi:hypothetical protein